MLKLSFGASEKQTIEEVINSISRVPPSERDVFLNKFLLGRAPVWKRFLKAAYHQPITWWVGVIQLQMQLGIWGQKHKGNALARANLFGQIMRPIREEMSEFRKGGGAPITKSVFIFCRRYFKTEFSGRLAGSFFTNYALTGGRLGKIIIPTSGHISIAFTNFMVAGYGAAIQAIASGITSKEAVLQSIFIGQARDIVIDMAEIELSEEETALFEHVCAACPEIFDLAYIVAPAPVPISQFCLRPENVNLRGICR